MRKIAACLAVLALVPTAAWAGGRVTSRTEVPPSEPHWTGEFDAARAQRNYELLMRGQKSLGELSPQELREVQELDAAVRARGDIRLDKRSPRQRCLDEEIKRAGGSPSRLEMGIIDLKCSQR